MKLPADSATPSAPSLSLRLSGPFESQPEAGSLAGPGQSTAVKKLKLARVSCKK